jgi:uncharacterized protein (TIGR00730 family)
MQKRGPKVSYETYFQSGVRALEVIDVRALTALERWRQIDSMSTIRNICVYCGSSDGADARFVEAAEELGRRLAAERIGLVYGGGGEGLMGRLARSTLAAGGTVTGIIPRFLIRKEHPLTAVQEMLIVDSMHERKQAMFDRADAFVALPGGIGTVEELVEQLTWAQLNRHTKPILIADIGGFWRPLLALLAHMRIEGFIREGFEARYLVAEKIGDVTPMLRAAAERRQAEPEPRDPVSPRNM